MTTPKMPEAWQPFAKKEDGPVDPPATVARKTLVTKLAEVMASVDRIAKRGHNDHFHYDFATESDITAAIRKELATRFVMIVPTIKQLTWREVQTRSGKNDVCCLLVDFDVYDGESGDTLRFTMAGEGQDSGDKCVPKAMTSALKYALLKLFMIPTGDDPEREDKAPQKGRRPVVSVDAPGGSGSAPSLPMSAAGNPPAASGGDSRPSTSRDYATTENATALRPDAITIRRVDTHRTKNQNVRRYVVVFSDGVEASTIKEQLGSLCEQLASENAPVTYETEEKGRFTNLIAVRRAFPEIQLREDEHDGPVDDSDVPF